MQQNIVKCFQPYFQVLVEVLVLLKIIKSRKVFEAVSRNPGIAEAVE